MTSSSAHLCQEAPELCHTGGSCRCLEAALCACGRITGSGQVTSAWQAVGVFVDAGAEAAQSLHHNMTQLPLTALCQLISREQRADSTTHLNVPDQLQLLCHEGPMELVCWPACWHKVDNLSA